MKTKNYFKNNKDYFVNKLKKYKLITSNEKLLPNGNTEFLLEISNELEAGDRMTINELAKIVNNLAIEMREGFIQVNKRLDQHDAKFDDVRQEMNTRFTEVDEKFSDMKQYMDTRFDKIEQRLDDHDAIFNRNNIV